MFIEIGENHNLEYILWTNNPDDGSVGRSGFIYCFASPDLCSDAVRGLVMVVVAIASIVCVFLVYVLSIEESRQKL